MNELLGRRMSYILRHGAHRFGLEIDPEGWVSIHSLLEVLHRTDGLGKVKNADIEMVVRCDHKGRYESDGRYVRALYGHSIKVVKQPDSPPSTLYHGTSTKYLESILRDGLLPMGRQYVHLSIDRNTAEQVALRHGGVAVVFAVDAYAASKDGVRFYRGNDATWLADSIATKYLK